MEEIFVYLLNERQKRIPLLYQKQDGHWLGKLLAGEHQALRRHTEAVPADFTARMLRQIREAEEKKILAQVVMKERLALAGCIGLGVVAVVVAAVFPSVAAGLIEQAKAFIIGIVQSIKAADYQWQSYAIFAGMFGITVYALVDMLASDS